MQQNTIQILWDELTRLVQIILDGQVIELNQRFYNKSEATEAALAHCRSAGLLSDDAI